ncbi:MAG: sugar porter family MFS transporter [Muribaculaceae bacterium]|nr:sugar porter family MFS transporter [Muribaculaceae bacterium]
MGNKSLKFGNLLLISAVSAMGGLLFGYDWVVIGGAKPFYEPFFGITDNPALQGWVMSSALPGCLLGALMSGWLSDKYGRKKMLISAAILFVLTGIGTGAANSLSTFITYRILGGFAIGAASNVSPIYIAEISPSKLRGRLVSLNQLTIVIGILAAQVVNWLVADPVPADATKDYIMASWNGQMGWRIMFWAETVPAIFFFIFGFFIPESPRWLSVKGDYVNAKKVLKRIGDDEFVENEMATISSAENSGKPDFKKSWKEIMHPSMRKVLIIGIVLAVFQQWCGINVIFNYAQEIFTQAGYGVSDVLMNIVITGVINVVFTVVAMMTVDKLGRRALLLIGSAGLAIIYLLIGLSYQFHVTGILLLITVVMAIACYAVSLAPVMWVVISEIFPNSVRGLAMSIATFFLWAACFVLTYTFPILNSNLGASWTFWCYGVICLLGYMFIFFKVPETKNKTLEEIEKELVK